MEEPPQPSHDALPAALPHATPPSLDVATPPTARDDRDERQSDGQHERERDEHDVLGFGTAASEVEDGQVDSREGTNEVGTNEVQEEQAGEGGGSAADSTESSSLLARMDVKEGPAGDNEAKEAGEIDQVEVSAPHSLYWPWTDLVRQEDKQGPRQKERPYHWQPSCIVPHVRCFRCSHQRFSANTATTQRPPHTITGPFGEPLTLSPRSANMHQIDQAVYSDPLPGVPPPHQTTYEYRLFLPFRSLGNSIIGPKGFYITNIRMRSRVGVAQVLFTEEDRKAHVLFVGSLGSIKRALEEIEDLVYRKEWGRWNSWELDKLQTMSSDWIRFSRSRATEIPGLWLKPEYADDDPQCARGPEGGDRSTPWPANANAKYSRDRSLPARPPSTGRRHSHPLPTRPPQRYYGLSRGFPHQRERDGRGLPPRVVSGPSQPRPHEHSRRSRSPDRRAPPLSSTKPRGSRRSPSPDMRHSRARTPVLGDDDEDDRSRRRSSRSRSPVRSRVKSASSKSLSPERPRGPTRSLLAVEEQEDEEPPTSYSIECVDCAFQQLTRADINGSTASGTSLRSTSSGPTRAHPTSRRRRGRRSRSRRAACMSRSRLREATCKEPSRRFARLSLRRAARSAEWRLAGRRVHRVRLVTLILPSERAA